VVVKTAPPALRSLVDAIVVYPGDRRGEVSLELRGDLAAFLHLTDDGPAAAILPPADAKTAASRAGNGGSGGMMGSLVAGAGNHRQLTRMMMGC
jgi:site-specific DNA recombinase